MVFSVRHAVRSGPILLVLLAAPLVLPRTLHGQEVAAAAPARAAAVDDGRLGAYAKAFAEVSRIRDEMQARLADPQNKTAEAQVELRESLRTRIAEAIVAAGLTEEEYRRITYVVSVDGERRTAFERMLSEAPTSGPGAS